MRLQLDAGSYSWMHLVGFVGSPRSSTVRRERRNRFRKGYTKMLCSNLTEKMEVCVSTPDDLMTLFN